MVGSCVDCSVCKVVQAVSRQGCVASCAGVDPGAGVVLLHFLYWNAYQKPGGVQFFLCSFSVALTVDMKSSNFEPVPITLSALPAPLPLLPLP